MEHRFISKNFLCESCHFRFKKLVPYEENTTQCDSCINGIADVIEDSEFNRENIDRAYRLSFTNGAANMTSEYHPVTDIMDRDPENIFGDARKTYRPRRNYRAQDQILGQRNSPAESTRTTQQQAAQQRQQSRRDQEASRRYRSAQVTTQNRQQGRYQDNLNLLFLPFTVSPFHGSVTRHANEFTNFENLFSDIFFAPTNDFFMDNFASNFTSNFINPFSRIVFIQSMRDEQPQGTPPASKEAIKNLKRFKMNEEFCKKGEKNEKEYPTCSVCLCELTKGEDSVLVPCGHLFHEICIMKWLELHNTCPVCRYELPTENNTDSTRQQRSNINRNHMGLSSVNGY